MGRGRQNRRLRPSNRAGFPTADSSGMSQAFSNHGRKFNKPASGAFLLTPMSPINPLHIYEVRPRTDHRGVDLISDALPFGRLWYGEPNAASNANGYAKFYSRSHDAVIRVYDDVGKRSYAGKSDHYDSDREFGRTLI